TVQCDEFSALLSMDGSGWLYLSTAGWPKPWAQLHAIRPSRYPGPRVVPLDSFKRWPDDGPTVTPPGPTVTPPGPTVAGRLVPWQAPCLQGSCLGRPATGPWPSPWLPNRASGCPGIPTVIGLALIL